MKYKLILVLLLLSILSTEANVLTENAAYQYCVKNDGMCYLVLSGLTVISSGFYSIYKYFYLSVEELNIKWHEVCIKLKQEGELPKFTTVADCVAAKVKEYR